MALSFTFILDERKSVLNVDGDRQVTLVLLLPWLAVPLADSVRDCGGMCSQHNSIYKISVIGHEKII